MYNPSLLEPIAARHLLVQYDGRGFGMSDRGVRDYSLEARLYDLEAVVGALALNRIALYAWGAGGPVAIAYAVRHPERVTRIAFNGAYAKANVSVLKGEERERQEPVYSLMEKRWDDPAFREMWASLMMPDGSAVDRTFFTKLQRASASTEDFVAFLKADDEIDTTALLSQIRAPTLVVHLRNDQILPLDYGRQLATLIPGARFVIVEGRDKMVVPGDGEAEQINQALVPFFDEDLPKQAGAATRQ
jgi:pimeloyl-ACP methyl ester carboxylesterase